MADCSRQNFGCGYLETTFGSRESSITGNDSGTTDDDDDDDEVWRSRRVKDKFVHSDLDFPSSSASKQEEGVPPTTDRPASSPGDFPNIDFYLPPGGVYFSRAEKEKDAHVKTRVNAWISRLDRLISDSSQADQSQDFDGPCTERCSSQETLTSRSSSKTEVAEAEEQEEEEHAEERWTSPCSSFDEVFGKRVVCQSMRDGECLGTGLKASEITGPEVQGSKPGGLDHGSGGPWLPGHDQVVLAEGGQEQAAEYCTGTVCCDVLKACEILNTRYKLEDVATRKPVMTWSKWNVSEIVRGPHDKSPIWNPSIRKKSYDRPNSIVFRELNRDIARRNEELELIVMKKTEKTPSPTRCDVPPNSFSPAACTAFATASVPRSPSTSAGIFASNRPSTSTFAAGGGSGGHGGGGGVRAGDGRGGSYDHRLPSSSKHPSSTIREVGPQLSSQSEPGGYPSVAMTTENANSDAESSRSAESPATGGGFGIVRRMVKAFWNVFLGDRGCHGDRSNSREALKADDNFDS